MIAGKYYKHPVATCLAVEPQVNALQLRRIQERFHTVCDRIILNSPYLWQALRLHYQSLFLAIRHRQDFVAAKTLSTLVLLEGYELGNPKRAIQELFSWVMAMYRRYEKTDPSLESQNLNAAATSTP